MAARRCTRLSSLATRTRSSAADSSSPDAETTSRGERRIQPETVDFGTPRRVAIAESPVSWTDWIKRWSYVRFEAIRHVDAERSGAKRGEKGSAMINAEMSNRMCRMSWFAAPTLSTAEATHGRHGVPFENAAATSRANLCR